MECIRNNYSKDPGVPHWSYQLHWTTIGLHHVSHTPIHSSQIRHCPHLFPLHLICIKKFSGLGILHPYYHQHIKHIHTCLKPSVTKSITKNLICTNTEQLCLELPVGFNSNGCWHMPITKAYRTPSWTHNLFAFLDEHSTQLIDTCATLSLRTTNDQFIMQIFQCHYQGPDLCILHQCSKFLQVLTVSDSWWPSYWPSHAHWNLPTHTETLLNMA